MIKDMDGMKQCCSTVKRLLKANLMNVLMVSGVIAGFLLGIVMLEIKPTEYSSREIMYVGFLGEIFLQMLKFVSIILMVACIVTSIGSLDKELSKRLGVQFLLYAFLTKLLSTFVGVLLGVIIRPGRFSSVDTRSAEEEDNPLQISFSTTKVATTADTFLDIVRNMFPSNVVYMFLGSYETVLIKPENGTDDMRQWDIKEDGSMNSVVNMLGIVFCSVILGVTLSSLGIEGKPLLELFICTAKTAMKITIWVIWTSPLLIIFLIAGQLLKVKGFIALLEKLGLYLVVILLGYAFLGLVVLPLIYFLIVWKNPFRVISAVIGALITAFATSSSLAAMPTVMSNLENIGYDRRLIHFIIPIGININKDGAAMFEGLAPIFFSQLYDRTLSFSDVMTVLLLGSSASMAAAAVPYSATILLIMVLEGIDLPYKDVGLILAMDWLVDRTSTVVNVLGNCIAVGILGHFNRKFLGGEDKEEEEQEEESAAAAALAEN